MSLWAYGVRKLQFANSEGGLKLRFLMVGGVNTLFGLAAYPVLMLAMRPLHLPYMIPLIISHPICITFSFLTNKFITFRTKKNYLSEFSKFGTFYLINFAVNIAALPVLVEFFHMNPIIAQLGFAFVVIVTSYFWHSRITFVARGLVDEKK
jgi:putative flippase GtrA